MNFSTDLMILNCVNNELGVQLIGAMFDQYGFHAKNSFNSFMTLVGSVACSAIDLCGVKLYEKDKAAV